MQETLQLWQTQFPTLFPVFQAVAALLVGMVVMILITAVCGVVIYISSYITPEIFVVTLLLGALTMVAFIIGAGTINYYLGWRFIL